MKNWRLSKVKQCIQLVIEPGLKLHLTQIRVLPIMFLLSSPAGSPESLFWVPNSEQPRVPSVPSHCPLSEHTLSCGDWFLVSNAIFHWTMKTLRTGCPLIFQVHLTNLPLCFLPIEIKILGADKHSLVHHIDLCTPLDILNSVVYIAEI